MATSSYARSRAAALLAVGAVVGGLVLAGCGDETEPTAGEPTASDSTTTSSGTPEPTTSTSATPTPSVPDRPTCEEAWGGERLAAPYRGCLEGDRLVEPQVFTCSQGGRLAIYRTSYALVGGKVNRTEGPLAQDPDYRSAIQACTA